MILLGVNTIVVIVWVCEEKFNCLDAICRNSKLHGHRVKHHSCVVIISCFYKGLQIIVHSFTKVLPSPCSEDLVPELKSSHRKPPSALVVVKLTQVLSDLQLYRNENQK